MNKIILASHGELAQGMKQTAAMIIGESERIYALSAFRDEDQPIKEQVVSLLEQIGYEDVYILTDIFGGSVNNDMLDVQRLHPEVHLLTGMNLSMVISIAMQTAKIDDQQMAVMIEESRQGMLDCKQLLANQFQLGGDDL